jgi:hypothetical protein
MPGKTKPKVIRKILRLLSEGLPQREIAKLCGVSKPTVTKLNTEGPPAGYDRPYATRKEKCRKHPTAATPCVECAAQAFNDRHNRHPANLPLSGIYDERHRRAADQSRNELLNEVDDFVNQREWWQ